MVLRPSFRFGAEVAVSDIFIRDPGSYLSRTGAHENAGANIICGDFGGFAVLSRVTRSLTFDCLLGAAEADFFPGDTLLVIGSLSSRSKPWQFMSAIPVSKHFRCTDPV